VAQELGALVARSAAEVVGPAGIHAESAPHRGVLGHGQRGDVGLLGGDEPAGALVASLDDRLAGRQLAGQLGGDLCGLRAGQRRAAVDPLARGALDEVKQLRATVLLDCAWAMTWLRYVSISAAASSSRSLAICWRASSRIFCVRCLACSARTSQRASCSSNSARSSAA
jgi:hypothetical protein